MLSLSVVLISCRNSRSTAISTETLSSSKSISNSIPSDSEIKERAIYILSPDNLPVYWWYGAAESFLGVDSFNANSNIQGDFSLVTRFDSIDEMKKATEELVTEEFAQQLYEFSDEHNVFKDFEGKLYENMEVEGSAAPWVVESENQISVDSFDNATANISVIFNDGSGDTTTEKIELKKLVENGN